MQGYVIGRDEAGSRATRYRRSRRVYTKPTYLWFRHSRVRLLSWDLYIYGIPIIDIPSTLIFLPPLADGLYT